MIKRIICFLTAFSLILSVVFCGVAVNADTVSDGDITIATVEGLTGDSVIVPITIKNNPGIMAVTISITYDSSSLEYVEFYKGDILKDYMVVAHPTKNLIRFVCCETKDRTNDGTLLSLKFNIAKDAKAKLHKIDIAYNKGDFCNWDLNKLMPNVTPGGIDVAYNGENCPHEKYGEWSVAAEPSCKEEGAKQHTCEKCGHIELKSTDPIGHEYSDVWTVDEPATAEKPGTMVRYCIRCTDFVDKITYTLDQAEKEESGIKNEVGSEFENNDFIEDIFKEQNPGEELTPNKPEEDTPAEDDKNSVFDDILNPDHDSDEDSTDSNSITDVFPEFSKVFKVFGIALAVLILLII